jgi:hypothetical protein
MILRRQPNFDIQDYLHLTSRLVMSYEPDSVPSGDVTAQEFVDYFLNEFDNGAYDDEHDFFGAVATDATGGVLEITFPCNNKVDLYPEEGSELKPADFVETVEGLDAILQKDQLQKEFPLIIGYIPGQGPDITFTGCQDICVIVLTGCIPDCPAPNMDLLTTSNATHLHTAGTKFKYELFVNSSAPGYAAFIADLNVAIAPCVVPLTVANTQFAATVPVPLAADAPFDLATLISAGDTFTAPISGTISNGAITLAFGPVATVPLLVAALNGAYPSAPVSFEDNTPGDGIFEVAVGTAFDTTATGPIVLNID